MPPGRNVGVLGGGYVPGIQPNSHRTPSQQQQSQQQPQQPPTPFMQQRTQGTFPFGAGLGQHQPLQQQQQQQQVQQQQQQAQAQAAVQGLAQQQTNGSTNSLPPHLAGTPNLPGANGGGGASGNGGGNQSVSSTSEVGLDPNDFPALGSTSASSNSNNANSHNNANNGFAGAGGVGNNGTSYASQAGTGAGGLGTGAGLGAGSGSGAGSTSQPRDFTPDDFPALGGQTVATSQGATGGAAGGDSHSHPPGLNGFDHPQQQHRQNLLGSLSNLQQQGTPGMLNLGAQARSAFEADKRNNYALKLNPNAQAPWNSTSPSSGLGFSNSSPSTQQNGTHGSTTGTHLNAPPGVPPPQSAGFVSSPNPNGDSSQPQNASTAAIAPSNPNANPNHTTPPNPTTTGINPVVAGTAAAAGGAIGGAAGPNSTQNPSLPSSTAHIHQHPQTPAQQILMSAADRWGLLGLLAMIKNAGTDVDGGLSSIGTDLGTMGLDMGYGGSLYSTFITPWADQSAAHTVEPDFHLPTCYNVHPPPPGPSKAQAFSDETLFFMFYSTPRDALQEVAAQELWNRNWRFHKELRLWITKESGSAPSQKVLGGESGTYTYWDPENWTKERKDMTVLYVDLEEKTMPAFLQGPGLVPMSQLQQGQQGQGQGGAMGQGGVGAGMGGAGGQGGIGGGVGVGAVGGAGQRGSFQVGVAAA
ncbi:hypothetical protein K435DRAFT_791661 [Dendrothele bispora CBS 962.96]|uniref:NOT2/NOT3/NOT5 C-terminal domain-containing protein n=1 Tax=Dendrothele bispora (strain CBS 962.96) TaxID=1314807 RepID=A0A4S8MLX3_DENBC|nr:hypothetical protein K435DRAFT_791661 [Dendrothele bispora CBS 962.96]